MFEHAGDLGILGAQYPEAVGGAGGGLWFSVSAGEGIEYRQDEIVESRGGARPLV